VERRHQVFVSSTYADLIEERREVIQALLELDCLPAGMELFPAANEDQWTLIKEVIDQTDYYVVIVGGRYGSTTPEGISYTEKEYDYAASIGVPIYGFVHKNPGIIPADKTELDASARELLDAFRDKVKSKPVKFYESPAELGGAVSRAISIAKTRTPREGWVRGQFAMTPEQQAEMAELRASVSELTRQLEKLQVADERIPEDLAWGEDEYEISATLEYYSEEAVQDGVRYDTKYYRARTLFGVEWNEIFYELGPALLNEASEGDLWEAFEILAHRYYGSAVPENFGKIKELTPDADCLSDVIVQLFALNLITHGVKKRSTTDRNKYWALTRLGQDTLMKLRAIPKEQDEDEAHQ
jgi:hypothetical protein